MRLLLLLALLLVGITGSVSAQPSQHTLLGVGTPIVSGLCGVTKIAGASGDAGACTTWQVLTADCAANATTTRADCMTTTNMPAGTWAFDYYVVWRSSDTTVGVNFSVNTDATLSTYRTTRHYRTTGTGAASGVADGDSTTLTGQLVEHMGGRVNSANLGPNTGVDVIDVDQIDHIWGTFVTSIIGPLQLRHASETAVSTQVMADTLLILRKLN